VLQPPQVIGLNARADESDEADRRLITANSPNPFAGAGWSGVPRDLLDGVIRNSPAPTLWVGLLFQGSASASPAVEQLRVDYGRDTYLPFLPGIYAQIRTRVIFYSASWL
jgi:hypothetical protein